MRLSNRVATVLAAAPAKATFAEGLAEFLRQARELAAGGLTLAELGHLFGQLIYLAVTQAASLEALSGEEKKVLVLQAVAQLFDLVAPAVPLPAFVSLFRGFLQPALRRVVLAIADGVIEAVYLYLKPNLPVPAPTGS